MLEFDTNCSNVAVNGVSKESGSAPIQIELLVSDRPILKEIKQLLKTVMNFIPQIMK